MFIEAHGWGRAQRRHIILDAPISVAREKWTMSAKVLIDKEKAYYDRSGRKRAAEINIRSAKGQVIRMNGAFRVSVHFSKKDLEALVLKSFTADDLRELAGRKDDKVLRR
jgi:hypothetical protein